MDETFGYIEENFRAAHPMYHYSFIVFDSVVVGAAAILTNIILSYLLSFIYARLKRFMVIEDVAFWVNFAFLMLNLCVTAIVALVLDRRIKRYWAREVLFKFATEGEAWDLFPQAKTEL